MWRARPLLRGRRGGGDAMVFMLLMQLAAQVQRLETKPPVTLALVLAQVALHLAGGASARATCFSAAFLGARRAPAGGVLWRLAAAPFVHGDDLHLYYNMSSLVWKGVQLEGRHGSLGFAVMVAALLVLSQAGATAAAVAAAAVGYDGWLHECAVGFSGVLFAMKVVLTAGADGSSYVQGLPFAVPTRYAAWAELVLIYLLVPNSSFVGHLGGILGGLAYLALQRAGVWAAATRELSAALAGGGGGGGGAGGVGAWDAPPAPPAPRDARADGGARGAPAPGPAPRRTFGSGTAGGDGAGPAPGREALRRRFVGGGRDESDADLARRLQAEEDARAARPLRPL